MPSRVTSSLSPPAARRQAERLQEPDGRIRSSRLSNPGIRVNPRRPNIKLSCHSGRLGNQEDLRPQS
jgi:hypothetical protein